MAVPNLIGKYALKPVETPTKQGLPDLLNTKYGLNNPTPVAPQSTLGKVGGVVKTVAKDLYSTAATIPVRVAQAEELLRTQAFGNADSQKKAQEFATTPTNIGFGTQVQPLDTSSTKRAAQQTIGDIIKTGSLLPIGTGLTLAKEAALMGGAYGLGNAMSEGKSIGNTIKDTAIGATAGGILGKGLSILGDVKTASNLAKKTDEQLFNEAKARANFGPIPEASNPRLSLPAPRTPGETPIQLPSEGILKGQQLLREGQPVVTTPVTAPTTPKVKSTTPVSKTEPITPRVTPEVISPEVKLSAEETFKATTPPESYIPGTEKGWIEAASSKGVQFAKDVVAGRVNPDIGVPKNAYFSVLKNIAEDTGDTALIEELKLANPARTSASVGAQELRATQITGKDNIVDVLYKIETDRYNQLSKNMQKLVDQEGTNASRKILEDVRNFKPTNDIINKITDILTCK